MRGEVSHTQIAGFLIALRTKGETVEELAGLARTMREFAVAVHPGASELLDTAGTGGGASSFNVSTTAALIAAGAGCPVAKHGNRSATSLSGSADVLEALGGRIDLDPQAVARCIDEVGFGFIFAPAHHQATRHVIGVRRELGVRTIFNLLGPLTNPAGATRQLVGVSDPRHLETIAGALVLLGVERALVVAGEDGLDEISAAAPTRIVEVAQGAVRAYTVSPAQLGIDGAGASPRGGTPAENAAVTRAILAGERGPAPRAGAGQRGSRDLCGRRRRHAGGGRRPRARRRRRRPRDGAAGALGRGDPGVSILDEILASTREDVDRRRRQVPDPPPGPPRDPHAFRDALAAPGISIIAEHKRRSPSAGEIRPGSSVARDRARLRARRRARRSRC